MCSGNYLSKNALYWRPVSVNNLFQACAKLKRYKVLQDISAYI